MSNLEEMLDQRKILTEFCFEKLAVQSVSFVKQASLLLYSELQYDGTVVDLGAEMT